MYGETKASSILRHGIAGLSPHVRGNHLLWEQGIGGSRSIPACTGKPGIRAAKVDIRQVYPRMYGETRCRVRSSSSTPGLSPHVRGNLGEGDSRADPDGSIPACTGKPGSVDGAGDLLAVYPRMYGETWICWWTARTSRGLSPHVRGNLIEGIIGIVKVRSIPACTGKPATIPM